MSTHDHTTLPVGHGAATPDAPVIGSYRLVRLLGEGGMGRVWLAVESHPVREVALKVVRGVSAAVIERMHREIEVLARLEHPGIARLYAAGEATLEGTTVPWLAMEYVPGVDLRTHVEQSPPDPAARIALVAAVARAVHYAHTRGVIHRDLKPGNILVDAEGRPKVLDFGIARLRDDGAEGLTFAGQVLGTVPYMSPEQLGGGRIDVASDVYALGAVAYELVAGCLPHPRLTTSTLFEALDIVRRELPMPLGRVAPQARGDLETVVMKALEADPARRYASMAAFADDLERVLAHRPVSARPPTRAYLASRFVRRYRALTAAAAITFLVLLVASIVSLRAAWSEQRARVLAEQRAQESAAVVAFLERMLASADPDVSRGRAPTVDEVVDEAERSLARAGAPAVERAVATTLASTRRSLGDYEHALALNTRALALAAADDAEGRHRLLRQRAVVLTDLTRFDEARTAIADARAAWPDATPLARLGLALSAARIDDDDGDVDAAMRAYRAILADAPGVEAADPVAAHELAATLDIARSNLSSLLRERGELDEAERLLREVLATRRTELGERAPATLASRHKLALVLAARGRQDEAIAETEAVLAAQREVLGDIHAATLTTMQSLANALAGTPRRAEAIALARESLAGFEKQFGEAHVQALAAMNTLAYLLEEDRQVEAAEAMYRRLVAIQQRAGETHPSTLAPRNNLAMLLLDAGRVDEACTEFHTLVDASRATLGADHVNTAIFMSNQGLCLGRLGRVDEARATLEAAHARLAAVLGPDHARTKAAAERLAALAGASAPTRRTP